MPTQTTVAVDGVTSSCGSGPQPSRLAAVVLLPGTAATAEDWDVVASSSALVEDRLRRQPPRARRE